MTSKTGEFHAFSGWPLRRKKKVTTGMVMDFWKKFQTILITGGSSGIGEAFFPELARRCPSARLVNLSRSAPREDLTDRSIDHFSVDLTNHESAEEVLNTLLPTLASGPLLLINNSGFGSYGEFPEPDTATQVNMVDLNVRAPVWLTGQLIPHLRQHGGAVINVASTAAFQPTPFMATYGASKAFLLHWSLGLHHDLKPAKVRVLALCPGPTSTAFFRRAGFSDQVVSNYIGETPEQVVRRGLWALEKGRASTVSGWKNRLLTFGSSKLPKTLCAALAVPILRKVRMAQLAAKK